MNPYKVDVAVLLLFFTRTQHTKFTFEQIRKARPSKLFLYQDGPRENRPDDIENIKECRDMVESMIDWDCEVHRLYQEKNYGCDPSGYLSRKWMFSVVDKGVIIEDDIVASESFFPFCKELLDKYENDLRINMICGQNHLGEYDVGGADYFFCNSGSIWGWATWRRTVDSWDSGYNFLEDSYSMKSLSALRGKKRWNQFVNTCRWHKSTGKEYFESIRSSNQYVNNQINIVPSKNMICNICIGEETTHSTPKITMFNRGIRKVFFQKIYEISFPLKHPNYVIDDVVYVKKIRDVMNGNFWCRIFRIRRIEGLLYRLFPILGKIGCSDLLKRVKSFGFDC